MAAEKSRNSIQIVSNAIEGNHAWLHFCHAILEAYEEGRSKALDRTCYDYKTSETYKALVRAAEKRENG